ncbi:MBL fold metallo-hydrolase [Archaeoglobus veneficus]|uniref:Beta-lactamase domain protein n=1 Tax=Archaeoglobus veneficus (strain DSM 11195 / SNP6) TaxID=693661 RepID=F2KRH0_ARCVS|nr:MBL fold metallo-hydrolase [Archaeoglobus veneficus]AEA46735.1 beta-lactamase domain protein [Archaeoglobus veneficus SNP6]
MKVTFLGTGTAVDTQKAQSCVLVEDSARILIDIGCGAFRRLGDVGVRVEEIDAVLITHNHLDHNADLLPLLKARWLENAGKLEIYGPPGTKAFVESLLEAFPYLRQKLSFEVNEESSFEVCGMKVETIPTFHSIVSRAYVIDGALVVSGDTRAFPELFSIECDALIHELSLPSGQSDFHTTPENMKECLDKAKAERIFYTHMYPHAYAVKDDILAFLGFGEIAEDLMSFSI